MKLRNLAQYISTRWREPLSCEACGEPFTCGARLSGCWCSEIELSESVRAELRARYRNCLCRACLERFAEVAKESPPGTPRVEHLNRNMQDCEKDN